MRSKVLAFLSMMSLSLTVHADSVNWEGKEAGKKVVIVRFLPSQNFTVVTNFVPFVDNALDLKLDGQVVYSFYIQGTNSYNQGFLNKAKVDLENSYSRKVSQCGEKAILIVGELTRWTGNLLGEDNITVVYPPSLQAVCEE